VTDCNFCTLQHLKIVANNANAEIVLAPNSQPGLGPDGIDVFIKYPSDAKPTWVAWFMKLTDHCVC